MNTLFEDVPFDGPTNLIANRFMTPQAPRAYRIGVGSKKEEKSCKRGNGPSAFPKEALAMPTRWLWERRRGCGRASGRILIMEKWEESIALPNFGVGRGSLFPATTFPLYPRSIF
jgi:hypothetical protein